LHELLFKAQYVRYQYFGTRVTYSRNHTIPLSNFCRNDCGYCAFRPRFPGTSGKIYSPHEIKEQLHTAREQKCWEVLFVTGEDGNSLAPVQDFLRKFSWESIEEYYLWGLQEAVSLGLLPHSNFGVIERSWLEKYKQWNASMGLMLESCSNDLRAPQGPHYLSPGKDPLVRQNFIILAGKLSIPFTTGILVGIGEDVLSRLESLLIIWKIAQRYDHIQEIIIQNFVPNANTPLARNVPPSREEMLRIVAIARILFQGSVSIQVPPNLNPKGILDFIHAGANDLGGISPMTIDFVNPDEKWPVIEKLKQDLNVAGFSLTSRLPVYDSFISDKFLSSRILHNIVVARRDFIDVI